MPPEIYSYIHSVMPKMDGWCSTEKATALAELVLRYQPISAVEVGVFAGRSLFAIGLAMKHNGFGRVVGIDPWAAEASVAGFENDPANRDWWKQLDHNAIFEQCKNYLMRLGLEKHVTLFRGTSQHAMNVLSAARVSWDFCHIDGNHSTPQALFDVESFAAATKPGGVVVLDDTDWNTVKPAQKRLSELCTELPAVGACGFYLRKPVLTHPD